jgi:acetaldehyde dehydrogenase / alcohol dehydrogenase
VVPTTNPSSTAIFKALIALKTRNAIVFSPHPRAVQSTLAAARVVREAAEAAGAPKGLIGWLERPTLALSQALMQHPDIKLILATGGPAMVHAAYSSGHPAVGVGSGNTPAIIDDTADVTMAVSSILASKTFDNGVICASEQSVVVMDSVYDQTRAEFEKRGAYFLTPEEVISCGKKIILAKGKLNVDIVGQSVEKLATLFGIKVPKGTRCLIGEVTEVGPDEPWAYEKLSPILACYRRPTFDAAVETAAALVDFAGAGHTSVLYTNTQNKAHIKQFELRINTCRMLINTPAAQGGIGDLYNFALDPSLTLGCGSWGDNSVSTNVTPMSLINIKTVAARRENMLWFRVPPKVYLKGGCLEPSLRELKGTHKRAFIVTDKPLYDLGVMNQVTKVLDSINVEHTIFYDVEPDPTLNTVRKGLAQLLLFKPDVIIAVGGGSPMDAAKIMWLMYEQPNTVFEGLSQRFLDIRKRVYDLPELGKKAIMIAIPTTSGTGSEVTPFSVITDESNGSKYPLADYALTPTMAIVDPNLTLRMPKRLTAYGGIDAVTHALESYVSICATEFTQAHSREALRMLFKYLPRAYANLEQDYEAREKVHFAATMAGMAFANAFLGICHSLAHKLGAAYHVPHGLANAAMISHVIAYNATDSPFKMATFSQYHSPSAKHAYAELSDFLGFSKPGDDEARKVIRLIEAVEALKATLDIPPTIREIVGATRESEYLASLDQLAENAFDDQCTGANPRYPLIKDLKALYAAAWKAPILPLSELEHYEPAKHL